MSQEEFAPCRIHVGNFTWAMDINLDWVCMRTGRKSPVTGVTGYTLGECKKLLKLIFQYASAEELSKADKYIREQSNLKVQDIWNKVMV